MFFVKLQVMLQVIAKCSPPSRIFFKEPFKRRSIALINGLILILKRIMQGESSRVAILKLPDLHKLAINNNDEEIYKEDNKKYVLKIEKQK